LDGNPICPQEKLWRVCTKTPENSLGGTFAGMEATLPLHSKNQAMVSSTREVGNQWQKHNFRVKVEEYDNYFSLICKFIEI
jgi:hypothetical protein